MMKTKRTCPNATLIAAIAAALLAMGGPKDDVAAQETQKSDSAKTRDGDPRAKQGSVVKPRKASCRCGKLTVTYKGPDPVEQHLQP